MRCIVVVLSVTTKHGPFGGAQKALNDLLHSDYAFSEFLQLSVP